MTFYLRGIVRTPSWTFSDIAIDQPTLRGTGVLLLGLALAGALFGAGGLFPALEGVAGTAAERGGVRRRGVRIHPVLGS